MACETEIDATEREREASRDGSVELCQLVDHSRIESEQLTIRVCAHACVQACMQHDVQLCQQRAQLC